MNTYDIHYMRVALEQAQKALDEGEVPIGAVIVDPYGTIIGQGYNRVEQEQSQSAHAEVCAIAEAGQRLGTWRLAGCSLYVTLEPCMMCVSLAALSRIERIVYGAASPRFGFSLDKEGIFGLYTRQIKSITAGVLAEEAALLLKSGFAEARGKDDYKSRCD